MWNYLSNKMFVVVVVAIAIYISNKWVELKLDSVLSGYAAGTDSVGSVVVVIVAAFKQPTKIGNLIIVNSCCADVTYIR